MRSMPQAEQQQSMTYARNYTFSYKNKWAASRLYSVVMYGY